MDEAKAAMLQGRLGPSRSQTLTQYLSGWLETVRPTIKPRTHESYALNARRILPHLGRVRLDALTPAQVQDCYNQLLASGLSPRSVQQAHALLHKALADAMRLDLVPRNVAGAVNVPRPRRREMQTLTAEQLQLLFEVTRDDRFGALWVLLGTAGLRLGEALGLKWSDIEFSRRTLLVRRAVQRQKGGVGLVFVEPKTARSRRTIQLSTLAADALKRHQERQTFERKTAAEAWHDHDLVFCTHAGNPLEIARIHDNFKPSLARTGLPNIRVHDLRHTAATLMLEQGVHPKVVQEMLGHSSIALTLDTYSHVAPTMHRDAVNRIDALFKNSTRAATS